MRLALFLSCLAAPAFADGPTVVDAKATLSGDAWRFDVTVAHPDTGWDHYADGWEVVDSDGNRLGFRELLHPHETEQPFTRSLSGVVIPDGTDVVYVRTRCNVDEWYDALFEVVLTQ